MLQCGAFMINHPSPIQTSTNSIWIRFQCGFRTPKRWISRFFSLESVWYHSDCVIAIFNKCPVLLFRMRYWSKRRKRNLKYNELHWWIEMRNRIVAREQHRAWCYQEENPLTPSSGWIGLAITDRPAGPESLRSIKIGLHVGFVRMILKRQGRTNKRRSTGI